MIKRPMKGEQIEDLSRLRFPLYASPKIDGFRCILGAHPMTSRLSPFPNRHFHRTASGLLPEGHMLDGEIVCGSRRGEGVLGRTSSGLTTETGEPDWTLWVFDKPGTDMGWDHRFTQAEKMVDYLEHQRIRILRHTFIEHPDDLEAYIERMLGRGYEGVMVRDPQGPYKEGKATIRQGWLLKIKPFEDFEARVTGYFEEMENTNEAKREATGKLKRSSAKAGKVPKGTLGGFTGIELKTGVEVRVGGGFTAAQRKAFWARRDELVEAGAIMKCKKQKMGQKDKPRHPNFICFRPEWDI